MTLAHIDLHGVPGFVNSRREPIQMVAVPHGWRRGCQIAPTSSGPADLDEWITPTNSR